MGTQRLLLQSAVAIYGELWMDLAVQICGQDFAALFRGYYVGADMSFPKDKSVNDGIESKLCSLTYTTVDQVPEIAVGLGAGALLANVYIESAYRLIPVYPDYHHHLASDASGGSSCNGTKDLSCCQFY